MSLQKIGWLVAYVVSLILFLTAMIIPLFFIVGDMTVNVLIDIGCSLAAILLGCHVGMMTLEIVDRKGVWSQDE